MSRDAKDPSQNDDWIPPHRAIELLGGSRNAFYKLIGRLKQCRNVRDAEGALIEIWVVGSLGGLKLPNADWRFSEAKVREFRATLFGGGGTGQK